MTRRSSSVSESVPRVGLWAEQDPAPLERLTSHRCVAALALGMAEARLDPHQCAAELAESSERSLLLAAMDHLDRVEHGDREVIGRASNMVRAALALVDA
ncbi:MAG: hypothetical protein EA388_13685 [Nitriliruptor sp.]|nr:MAG: hypothetical protein EA388_13685 [Nitriliruptor sp.]